jgi:hypothetical protein
MYLVFFGLGGREGTDVLGNLEFCVWRYGS